MVSDSNTTYIGFDCEFLPTGRTGDPASVHSVQFSDGENDHTFIESPDQLKQFFHNRRRTLKEIFGFNFLCDLGAVKEWLPKGSVDINGSTKIKAYDTRPLLVNFGLSKLEQVGEVVGISKLPKPEFLGLRKWETWEEYEAFKQYALQDAIVTSRAAKWLIEQNQCDPREHASAGTLAKEYFQFPKRHKRAKNKVLMPPIERTIAQSTYAGRSEIFVTGYTPYAVYNDVKSLYPCSVFTTNDLTISGVEPSTLAVIIIYMVLLLTAMC
jgi:hypothetical protein